MLFPFVHAMFATLVSSSRTVGNKVALSPFMSTPTATSEGDDNVARGDEAANEADAEAANGADDAAESDRDDDRGDDANEPADDGEHAIVATDNLGKRERAVLEFFIAQIRFRS